VAGASDLPQATKAAVAKTAKESLMVFMWGVKVWA
jgi:hypothetical protein